MTLESKAARAAAEARCNRCQNKILEVGGGLGTVTGYYRAVALGVTAPFQLCGTCGLELREFLNPDLADDALYRGLKRTLEEGWAA